MSRRRVAAGLIAACGGAALAALAQPLPPAAASPPLRLVSTQTANPQDEAFGRQRLDELMKRAGLAYTVSLEPMERAASSLRAGLYDGDAARVAGFDKELPGLLRVDPPWLVFEIRAYGRQALPPDASWPALDGRSLAYVRGQRAVEHSLQLSGRATAVSSGAACMGMAAAGRVDYCVIGSIDTPATLPDQPPLQAHTLGDVAVHIWLRAGHEAQARRLAAALHELGAQADWRQRPAASAPR